MHLMYYISNEGKRVYTLKVIYALVYLWTPCFVCDSCLVADDPTCNCNTSQNAFTNKKLTWNIHSLDLQKIDPLGQPTKSAHPGNI